MASLLIALAYWCVIGVAAFGALITLTFAAMVLAETFRGPAAERRRREAEAFERHLALLHDAGGDEIREFLAALAAEDDPYADCFRRPFDQDDPLEHQFALPCAPDPRVR